uniref:Uncharacterized protein n=1 Tax=Cyanoderma ruficeps TaxID=181631 RepID=A0A8C3XCI0_9PASS
MPSCVPWSCSLSHTTGTTHGHQWCSGDRCGWGVVVAVVNMAVVDVTVGVTVSALVQVVLDQVVGILCPHPPVVVTPCQALVRVLVDHLLWQTQHLLSGSWGTQQGGLGTLQPPGTRGLLGAAGTARPRDTMGCWGLRTPGSPCAAPQKPWQVCVTLKLCRTKPGAAPTVPVLEAPGSHLQGSGGAGLSPKALPLPLPLCWLCRTLVARAEAAVPVSSVATAVAGLCRALPLPVAGACQCLAERYAALALEGLLGRLGPRLLCRLFLACRGGDNWDNEDVGTLPPPWVLEAIVVRLAECVSEEDPQGLRVPALSLPLGPCALGPIFWCSGPKAAQRCQALQHCQEHVWL